MRYINIVFLPVSIYNSITHAFVLVRSLALDCVGCLSWSRRRGSHIPHCVWGAYRPCWTCYRDNSLRASRLNLQMYWVRLPLSLFMVSLPLSLTHIHLLLLSLLLIHSLFNLISFSPQNPSSTYYWRRQCEVQEWMTPLVRPWLLCPAPVCSAWWWPGETLGKPSRLFLPSSPTMAVTPARPSRLVWQLFLFNAELSCFLLSLEGSYTIGTLMMDTLTLIEYGCL